MIQIIPQMRIWMAVEAVDFRRGIDPSAHRPKPQGFTPDLISETLPSLGVAAAQWGFA